MAATSLAALVMGAPLLAEAQSDPAGFEIVVNLPDDILSRSVPDFAGRSNVQINAFPMSVIRSPTGGPTGFGFGARDGSVTNVEVNLLGGFVGGAFFQPGSTLNVISTAPNRSLAILTGGTVNLLGGRLDDLNVLSGSEVNVFDGVLGDLLDDDVIRISRGSTSSVSGGVLRSNYEVGLDGTAVVSGGVFEAGIRAGEGGDLTLLATEFFLDGEQLDLGFDEAFALATRDATLSGTFLDGSAFSFALNSAEVDGADFFSTGANVTLTRIPEPTSLALLGLGGASLLLRRRCA